ncbi:MAG: beta-galactosidase, partial [Vicinamibacterales bacterium]
MQVRIVRVLIALVVVSACLPAVARAAEPATQPGNPLVFGIAAHAWWLDPEAFGDQLLAAIDDLGVTTVRLSIDWRRFEPVQGQFSWGMYDRVLGALAERNIVIVANFNTIPGWASVDEPGCDDPLTEIYLCQLRADMYPAFERAIAAAVGRYAWIAHWEFWNEPEMWR